MEREAHFDSVLVPLLATAEREPGNFTNLLIAADRLQELDAEPSFETALRWMAKRGRHPVWRDDIKRLPWRWYRDNAHSLAIGGVKKQRLRPSGLPVFVFRCCCRTGALARREYIPFGSWESAAQWLAAGLKRIRDDYL